MARVYDNWERLVDATLRREELRDIALRTPSSLSLSSSSSSSSLLAITIERQSQYGISNQVFGPLATVQNHSWRYNRDDALLVEVARLVAIDKPKQHLISETQNRGPNMAETVVSFVLDKLSLFLREEASLLGGLRQEVQFISDQLGHMRALLKVAEAKEDDDPTVKEWIKQVREVVYVIEDVLDAFVSLFAGQRSKGGSANKIFKRILWLCYR